MTLPGCRCEELDEPGRTCRLLLLLEQDRNDVVLERIRVADAKYLAALKAVIG